jgi:hypothetical protein
MPPVKGATWPILTVSSAIAVVANVANSIAAALIGNSFWILVFM